MANTKSTQHEIPLNGGLNLNKFNAEIKPYEGFNERNSPMYGGCLSPLWIKSLGSGDAGVQYYKGIKWEVKEGQLYRNDVPVMSFDQAYFTKEPFYNFAGKDIPELFDENNYIESENNSITIHYRWAGQNLTFNVPSGYTFVNATFFKEDDNNFDFALLVTSGGAQRLYYNIRGQVSYANPEGTQGSYGTMWGILDTDILLVNANYIQINTTYFVKESGYVRKYAATCGYTTINDKKCIVTVDGKEVKKYIVKSSDDTLLYASSYDTYAGNMPKFLMTTSQYSDELSFNLPILFITNNSNIKHSLYFHCNKSYGGFGGSGSGSSGGNGSSSSSSGSSGSLGGGIIGPGGAGGGPADNPWYSGGSSSSSSSSSMSPFIGNNIGFGVMGLLEGTHRTKQYIIYDKDRPGSVYTMLNVVEVLETDCPGTALKAFEHPEWYASSIHVFGNLPIICARLYSVDHQEGDQTVPGGDLQQVSLTNSYQGGMFSYVSDNGTQYISASGGIRNQIGYSRFSVLATASGVKPGTITGISYTGYGETTLGTLVTPWGSISGDKKVYELNSNCVTYFDVDLKLHTKIEIKNNNNPLTFIGDYVVINTTSYLNCYHIPTGARKHWASDWNNTFTLGDADRNYMVQYFSSPLSNIVIDGGFVNINLVGGQNIGYKKTEIPSLFALETTVYKRELYSGSWSDIKPLIKPGTSDTNTIEIFQNGKYAYSYLTSKITESSLDGQDAPAGNPIYNIPIIFTVYKGSLDVSLIGFGSEVRFALLVSAEGEIRYQYYDTSITELLDVFIVQGQAYGIQNNQIYRVEIAGNVVNKETAIVDITGLKFVANTIYNAYFYSPTARAIYAFGADNNLTMFSQADTITGISGASYMPSTGSIILGTTECTYVLNESFGIYRLPNIKNFAYADQKEDTITLVDNTGSSWELSFEEKPGEDGWEKQSVIIDTQFYGAGSNVVSVNDCWYIRVTDPEHSEGEVKLAVSSLTDIGRTTETRNYKIKAKDWDEMTHTYYIRFQPKLQRAVGVSLHLESPFKVAYIGVGATPETLQLNKGTI